MLSAEAPLLYRSLGHDSSYKAHTLYRSQSVLAKFEEQLVGSTMLQHVLFYSRNKIFNCAAQ